MLQNGNYEALYSRIPCFIEFLEKYSEDFISSTILANALNYGEVQVRKDLAKISFGGRPKIGYRVSSLLSDLKHYMGYDISVKAVIVGMGRLGEALNHYRGFEKLNLEIVAAFDINDRYFQLSDFKKICFENSVSLGIITVPKESAQEVADMMVESNIRAIWNFASSSLVVPNECLVKNENMAHSLTILLKLLKDKS